MTLHLDSLHKSLKAQRLLKLQEHQDSLAIKKETRKNNTLIPYTPEPDVEFKDINKLKAARGRMGNHSGYTGVELRAIRREKGVGRPV